MNNRLIWCKCDEWQEWINGQQVELGQPMLKNDRGCAMMELKDRCKFITFAHPKLRGFDSDKRRYYLPKSLDQVLDFLTNTNYGVVSVTMSTDISIRFNMKTYKESDWYTACSKLVKETFNVKID